MRMLQNMSNLSPALFSGTDPSPAARFLRLCPSQSSLPRRRFASFNNPRMSQLRVYPILFSGTVPSPVQIHERPSPFLVRCGEPGEFERELTIEEQYNRLIALKRQLTSIREILNLVYEDNQTCSFEVLPIAKLAYEKIDALEKMTSREYTKVRNALYARWKSSVEE